MRMPLKFKYRDPALVAVTKNGSYRNRSGPKCCNDGCASTRKKSKKAKAKGTAHATQLKVEFN